ncbi:YegP family protein [Arthrobacter sp. NPDC058127]|uniref:YegP family protein n=1 Tax=Arthrobacter sp. NPDC058127 TaxID=3346351 RepID=UPI0036EBC1BB
MASQFNLHVDADARLRFQLVTGNGDVLLTSTAFEDEDAAIAAIWSVREAAVKGRIIDLTGSEPENHTAD